MKFKQQLVVSAMVLIFAAFLAGCSGGKKEHEAMAEDNKTDTLKTDVTSSSEVKAFENVDSSVKEQINGFLEGYFALNQALIEDNQDRAKAAAKKLSETINGFDMSKLMGEQMDFYHVQVAKLNQGIKGIDQSADIDETRLELVTLSEGMYALAKAFHPHESALYYQFCPMAKNGDGANWLSSTKEIINPYMGQRMLNCGRTEETLN